MLYRYTSAKHERQPNQAAKPEFRAGTASIVVVPDTSSALPKTDSGFDPAGCPEVTDATCFMDATIKADSGCIADEAGDAPE
jgi:hypothetical protein